MKAPEPALLSAELVDVLEYPDSLTVDWLEELKTEPALAAAVLTAALEPPVKTLDAL